MNLVKRKQTAFPSVLDYFFNDAWTQDMTPFSKMGSTPAVNVRELDTEYQIELVAPGMKKDEFSVEIEENLLKISAEHREGTSDQEEGNYTRREFHRISFERMFQLPEKADRNSIKASYDDGIILVTILKKKEKESFLKKIKIA